MTNTKNRSGKHSLESKLEIGIISKLFAHGLEVSSRSTRTRSCVSYYFLWFVLASEVKGFENLVNTIACIYP
jgi:hypothetical protein